MVLFGKALEQREQVTVLLETLLAELRHGGPVIRRCVKTAFGSVMGRQHTVGKGRECNEAHAQFFKYGEKPFVMPGHHRIAVLYGSHGAYGMGTA